MIFSERSSHILKKMLPHFKNFKLYKRDKTTHKDLDAIFLELYEHLHRANLHIQKLRRNYIPNIKKITDNSYKKPESYGGVFFPQEILKYIETHKRYQLIYKGYINKRNIEIVFTSCVDIDDKIIKMYNNCVNKIFVILEFLSQFSEKNCGKRLTLFFYFTEFKKRLPEDQTKVLGPYEVNTGFTKQCAVNNEVVIYRKEEWFKVLIHELMHSFGLEFRPSYNIRNKMKENFNIKSKFLIEESYAEVWARIINCIFCSYFSLKNKRSKSNFLLNVKFTMELERGFSLFQCGKILSHMNLRFKDLMDPVNYKLIFRENSNIFSYYILGAIFMNNFPIFLKWCNNNIKHYKNNKERGNIIQFNAGDLAQEKFLELILDQSNDASFERNMNAIVNMILDNTDEIRNSLMMTIVEI